ncbi:MAG: IMPACT family protein [Mycoplasmatales bacterium]
MQTVKQVVCETTEIKKSEFICLLKAIQTVEQANEFLVETKLNYPNASHYCTVYKLGQTLKLDDDGEPSQTAAAPMYNVLEHHNFDYYICIVIRYFGGIKLGAGGLVRAYSQAVSNCLKENEPHITSLTQGLEVLFEVNFNHLKKIENILRDLELTNVEKQFANTITFQVIGNTEVIAQLERTIQEFDYTIEIIKIQELLVEKIVRAND